MGRKRYQRDAHTGPIDLSLGGDFWRHLGRQFSDSQLNALIAAFFRRDSIRVAAREVGVSPNTIKSYFRMFQTRIAEFQSTQVGDALRKTRRTTYDDIRPWLAELKKEIGRPLFPVLTFSPYGAAYRIDPLDPAPKNNPFRESGEPPSPSGIVVTTTSPQSPVRRQRSFHFRTRNSDGSASGVDPRIGNRFTADQFGEGLLAFLGKLRGVPRARFHDALLEFEWKTIVRQRKMLFRFTKEMQFQRDQLRDVLRATENES